MANDNWQLKAILSAVDNMSPALKQIAAQAKNTRKYLGDIATSAGNLGSHFGLPIAAITGMLTGLTVGAVKKAVVGFTEMSEEIKKGALQAGMSTDQYQRMSYVAMQAGVDVTALGGATGMLNRKLYDAANGKNKNLANLLKVLGLSARDANGAVTEGVNILPQLADAFERNTNFSTRAGMGVALFGKKWQEIIPLLAEGGEGIAKSLARFGMLKSVISPEDLQAGKDLGDLFNDVGIVLKGFAGGIAKPLIPIIKDMVNGFINMAAATKKSISKQLVDMSKQFAETIKTIDWAKVVGGVLSLVGGLGSLALFLAQNKLALIAFVAYMNMNTIKAVGDVGLSVFKLGKYLAGLKWGALIAANPFTAIAIGIAAVALLIYVNWDNIVAYVGDAWARIKAGFDVGFFSGMIQLWLEQWQALANGILGIVKTITPDFLLPDVAKKFNFSFATDRAQRLTGVTQVHNPSSEFTRAPLLPGQLGPTAMPIYADSAAKALTAPTAPTFADSHAPATPPWQATATPSLAAPARQPLYSPAPAAKMEGSIKVDFTNVPQGARVEQSKGGSMPLNLNVGYSGASLGGAF